VSDSRTRATLRRKLPLWSQLEPLLGGRGRVFVFIAVISVISGLTESGILAVVAQVAASLVSHVHTVHLNLGPLHASVTIGAVLAVGGVLAVVRLILQIPMSVVPARIAADVQTRFRNELFGAFTHASWPVQSRDREGHVQEMVTNQVLQASAGVLQAASLVIAAIAFGVLVISALVLNLVAAAVVLVAAVLLALVLQPLNAMGGRAAASFSEAQMDYASGIGEAIRMSEETHVFGVADEQVRRTDALAAKSRQHSQGTMMLARLIPNLYQSMIYLILVGGLAVLYLSGAGHVAQLGAVVLILVRAGTYGQQMQGAYHYMLQATPFIDRLHEAERRYLASTPVRGYRRLASVEGLAFESVSYAYVPGRDVLRDVSFEVAGGEAVGIIGPSGAGKSTMVQILLRLRDPRAGRYLVNGIPATQFASMDWRRTFAYVPQDPRLVHASVADNIRYFRDIPDEAVENAARLACIHDDITRWASGYDTIVGPRADAVSGGQRQRICLARALAASPEILVLDEPTSALDPRSESLLQESLVGLRGSVTLFIIAHRMSTLSICGRVMVVVDGRVEAFDEGAPLLAKSSYYRSAISLSSSDPAHAVG
jgi:ABC-type multidrug transport system fused ATPase/permease subunit